MDVVHGDAASNGRIQGLRGRVAWNRSDVRGPVAQGAGKAVGFRSDDEGGGKLGDLVQRFAPGIQRPRRSLE